MKRIFVVLTFFVTSMAFAQQKDYVDFKSASAFLGFVPDSSMVFGKVWYKFEILQPTDSVYLDAVNMDVENVEIRVRNENPKPIDFNVDNDKIYFKYSFEESETYTVYFDYEAYPKKALYFLKRNNDWQIWTQGQGKYTSNWFPSIDDVNDKIVFNLGLVDCEGNTFLSNGVQSLSIPLPDNCVKYHYNMQKPMSSYLLAVAIGKYNKKTETSKSGIPLEYYYYPEDSLKVEPTYRYSKRMFDFLEKEIGFAYPWQNYKQVPVHDFLYAGMENTSCTIFSDAFVVDSIGFNDRNYINVNAHELAHQWFGNLVTATSGEHHWLQEGFATYYALLAERDIFDDNHFYLKLLNSAIDLGKQDIAGSGTSLLNPKSSSLTFYQRGAWVLHALRSKVGDEVFKQAVKNYLEKHQFDNVETSDFISEVERLYGKSLSGFVNQWIKQKDFPVDAAFDLFKNQSTYINEYLMVDCQAKSSKCAEYLKYYVSEEAKVKIISQAPELVTSDTFKHGLKVRQAISKYVTQIPKELKEDYETLLDDKSYITIENALYNLWTNFPEERAKYLSKTRNIHGFSDKNVRLLWLVLNLNTPFYQADNKQGLYEELVSYTDEKHNADLRINAFQYLDLIKSCNDKCLSNLEQAKSHHNWRLVKFAKQMSEQLQQNKN
ncbi:M1 family metallopeptidase [Winogradskyella ouciana]|uniref:Aminopeptidase N n=1 Tax=Winogradskyella ouciana TaxID=2608631 RepID=A0A7K1G9S1_9FLAO|nr:M1 family metallopeptidase [Winogradskyella ouciana]MTE26042.1 M1 family peptidase [Winogradskyella ouciana]